jgi:putative transposase
LNAHQIIIFLFIDVALFREAYTIAESFFKTIKVEWIYGHNFKNREQAQLSIFEWIESWYNRRRRHSALGYQTIEEFEKNNYNFKNAA